MQRLEMEQQQKDLAEYTQMSVNFVMTQVPQIVQGVLVGMGGYFNVPPLQ
jgi:phage shock protein PspC (stress-responsive transcriptional regulator)